MVRSCFSNGCGGVDHHDHAIGEADGVQGRGHRHFLQRLARHPRLLAQARGVVQQHFAVLGLPGRGDGIARQAGFRPGRWSALRPASWLNRLDLPTLGRPTSARRSGFGDSRHRLLPLVFVRIGVFFVIFFGSPRGAQAAPAPPPARPCPEHARRRCASGSPKPSAKTSASAAARCGLRICWRPGSPACRRGAAPAAMISSPAVTPGAGIDHEQQRVGFGDGGQGLAGHARGEAVRRRRPRSRRCRSAARPGRRTPPPPTRRSRVTPGVSCTMAMRRPTSRLKRRGFADIGPADDGEGEAAWHGLRARLRLTAAPPVRRRWSEI